MYMDEAMDSGDIISQEEYTIKETDNVGILHDELSKIGAELLIKTLPSIIDGTNNRIKQNISDVTYAYNVKREDELVNFNDNGKNIINKIRGLNPWPLSNFKLDDIEIKIIDAHFIENKNISESGIVFDINKNVFGISCKDGIIYLDRIKPFGKKAMDIKDYLNGITKEEYKNKKVNG